MTENETAPASDHQGGEKQNNDCDRDTTAKPPRHPFAWSVKLALLTKAARDSRLVRTDLAVFSVIVDHANRRTGMATQSVATTSKESGVPRSTVIRSLRRIEGAGYFVATKRLGVGTIYQLTGLTVGTGTGLDGGTGLTVGTGSVWNASGRVKNLKAGPTSELVPVPTSGHKQVKDRKAESRATRKASRTKKPCAADFDFSSWPSVPSEQIFQDWLTLRKKRNAPVTSTVMVGMGRQLKKALALGFSVDAVLTEMVLRGWQGFEAEWLQRDRPNAYRLSASERVAANNAAAEAKERAIDMFEQSSSDADQALAIFGGTS